nr:MAG: hypothetical protein [Bacteriophage sp.]
MTHRFKDVSIDQLMVEHYLFDLNQSVEKTAEILDIDEETVRQIHRESSKFYSAVRKDR